MAYHYTESGLDNVYLGDGYTIHETAYGKGLSVRGTEALHRAIGAWLVSLPKRLNGAELRFLRLEMEMTQKSLAAVLASEEQSVRRWEKARDKPIPGPADRLLRALYSEAIGIGFSFRPMIEHLAEAEQIERAEAHLHETGEGWAVSGRELAA